MQPLTKPDLHLTALGTLRLQGPTGELLARRRKELGLLLYIACRGPRAVPREELLVQFWGEREEEKARNSLRQALLQLRRAVGDALQVGPDDVRLTPGALSVDVVQFETHVKAGDYAAAIDLWHGEFVSGTEDNSEGFRIWVAGERARLHKLLAEAYARQIGVLESSDARAAIEWCRRWCDAFPFDELPQQRLIALLLRDARAGEARAQYAAYTVRMKEEDFDPSPEWQRLGADLEVKHAESVAAAVVQRRKRSRTYMAVVLAATLFGWGFWLFNWLRPDAPTLAVGNIDHTTLRDSVAGVASLLATNLARVPALHVISADRMEEVRGYMRGPSDLRTAARTAGATEVLEGTLTRRQDGGLRFDVRRVNLRTGTIRAAYTAESADALDLIDLVTEQIARDLGTQAMNARATGTTSSLVAYRFYEEGLRAYYAADHVKARGYFESALREDTTFAMAAHYMARTASSEAEIWAMVERARRLGQRGGDRERLITQASWAHHMQDPSTRIYAESLAVRYPHDPDSHITYAVALTSAGEFLAAIRELREAVALDSLSIEQNAVRCHACSAYRSIAHAYYLADSINASVREARAMARRRPDALDTYWDLANANIRLGNYAEATAMLKKRITLDPSAGPIDLRGIWLRTGDFDAINRYDAVKVAQDDPNELYDALISQSLSLRYQGRLREALQAVLRARSLPDGSHLSSANIHAQILFEMGRFRQSAQLFDSTAYAYQAPTASRVARGRAGMLALEAAALAAAGDTARLRGLEDTVRAYGRQSMFARDQRLHFYVRGLRLARAGRHAEAVSFFERALYSKTEGFSKVNFDYARSLLALGRAQEASALLRSTLIGPHGASGTYVTHTDFQQLQARAFEMAGQADSAAVYERKVAHALRRADAGFVLAADRQY